MNVLLLAPVEDFAVKDGGYGNASLNFYRVLQQMKKDKRIKSIDVMSILQLQKCQKPTKTYDVAILIVNPFSLLQSNVLDFFKSIMSVADKKYLLFYWETVPLPPSWDSLFGNPFFDGYIVSSYFLGVQVEKITEKPVYYLPCYIDTSYDPIVPKDKAESEDIFTVLFVGQNTTRKGLQDAVLGFSRIFNTVEDAQMIVKAHTLSQVELPIVDTIQSVMRKNTKNPQCTIYTLTEDLEFSELMELYKSSSVLLFCSRAEGFGQPPAEAMSIGLPIIYTDWTSLPEVCDSPSNLPLDYTVDEAYDMAHHGYEFLLSYSIPKIRSIMLQLHKAYINWKDNKENYYNVGAKNVSVTKKKFSYDVVADCFTNIFEEGETFAPSNIFSQKDYDRALEIMKEGDIDA